MGKVALPIRITADVGGAAPAEMPSVGTSAEKQARARLARARLTRLELDPMLLRLTGMERTIALLVVLVVA